MIPRVIAEGRYAIVDVETTGLDRVRDEIIQVAYGQVDLGRLGMRGVATCRPYREIQYGAQLKHGLTAETLEGSQSFSDIAGDLYALIGSRTLLVYGNLDQPMLQHHFKMRDRPFDTLPG